MYKIINRKKLSCGNTKTPLCKTIGSLRLAPFIQAVLEDNMTFSMNQLCRENARIKLRCFRKQTTLIFETELLQGLYLGT